MESSAALARVVRQDPRAAAVLERAREYRRRFIDPVAAELDRRLLLDPAYHAADLARAGCQYGFLSLPIPAFLGGGGGVALHSAVLIEELCAGCAGIANIFGAHYLGISGLLLSFDLNLFDRFLRLVPAAERRGEPLLFAAAITEPTAGTDVEDAELLGHARLSMGARKVAGGYVLDGRKCFISNGSVASYTLLTCAVDRRHPVESWSGFLVPTGTKGFSVGRVELKLGQRACHAAELVFEDCFIPDDLRIGLEGGGVQMTAVVLAASRAPVAAIATGIARGAYEAALSFARAQPDGGGRLIDRQWAQQALADMHAALELGRQAYLEAASTFDQQVAGPLLGHQGLMDAAMRLSAPLRQSALGLKLTGSAAFKRGLQEQVLGRVAHAPVAAALGLSSLAKFSCSDLAMKVCLRALELLGPAGAEERHGVEKRFRDAKLTQIYEGTNQLNRRATFTGLVAGGDAWTR
jgi:alkylation response protein AidB-like acyl-CoA dehydrogenase